MLDSFLRSHRSWIASLLEYPPTPVHDYLPIKIGAIFYTKTVDKKVVDLGRSSFALHNRKAWIGSASRASRVLPKVRSSGLLLLG